METMTTLSEFKISIMQGWCSCLDPRLLRGLFCILAELSCYQLVKLCSKGLIEQYHHHRRRRRHHHHRFNVHFSIMEICSIFTVFESDGIWLLLLLSATTTFDMTVHAISPSCCVRGALGAHIHFLRMVDRRNVFSQGFIRFKSAEAVVDQTILVWNVEILQVEGNSRWTTEIHFTVWIWTVFLCHSSMK